MSTTVRTHTETLDALLDATREIGPLIREHADEGEKARRLSPKVFSALKEARLFRMLLPHSLGGLEVDPVTCARVVEEVARYDSAAGWLLQAGNTGAWWSARLPTEGVEEIYGKSPDTLMAAAFHPPQQAVQVAGGYRITGRGPLASNVRDSEWLFLTALVMDGQQPRMVNGMPQVIALVLRTGDVKVVDTWYSLGMRATDSNDVVMDDVFVPESRTFPFAPQFEPGEHFRGPLYRFPGAAAPVLIIAPVPLAVAREAITGVRELVQRKTALGFNRPLRDRPIVQATLARAEAMLRSARLFYYDTVGAAWARVEAGEPVPLEQKADLMLAGTHAVATAAKVTDMMHRIAGSSGIYTKSPLERHFRDAQTLRHHGLASENRFEAAGQVYCGVEPEFVLVAF
jgi:alkylation response protein AidB-like acyl-CoA dehydrogenase